MNQKKGKAWTKPATFALNSWRTLSLTALLLMLATTTLLFDRVFNARMHPIRLVKGLPMGATHILNKIVEDTLTELPHRSGLVSVRDIVTFPDEAMLLVGTVPGINTYPPSKDNLECLFGGTQRTRVLTIDWKDDSHTILAVRCEYPSQALNISKEATLRFKDSSLILPSSAEYRTNSSWKTLVYETATLADSVLLFAKGLTNSQGKPEDYSKSLDQLSCRFGLNVRSRVKAIAQELVRCELPPADAVEQLNSAMLSLHIPKVGVLPSVAKFKRRATTMVEASAKKPFHICSCTMLWNQAPFLREWIMYHGFLGIERWYLYDNNSDDDIEEVLEALQREDYNVTRHPWPWVKTQEAGFSHCALRAKADCDWVMFTDVDEFVFPVKLLKELASNKSKSLSSKHEKVETPNPGLVHISQRTSILRNLIEKTLERGKTLGKNVGEVRLVCHNFGPSGLTSVPQDGVMMGYTCRMQWPQRHKSFVLLDAMSDSLMNVVHHFALRDGYDEMAVHARVAVINHYKFQSWDVFRAKFVRRVATYVVDWREQSADSRDRAPDLGLDAVEPPDWPSRYCEEQDWGLRNFTWNNFRHPTTQLMPWQ